MSNSAWLGRFLRQQAFYVFVALVVCAVFWGLGQPIGLPTVVVYALCIGNLISPPLDRISRRISAWPSPYNWLMFLGALVLLTPPVYLISSVVVWWIAPPSPQPLRDWIVTGWKLPSLITLVFGITKFRFSSTKDELERRNVELQRSVELGAAQLEMQEQDMERAREIQQALLPKSVPQLPGFEVATAWRPARAVGGDYFDVLRLGETQLAICIADVVGKGMSAALLMANVQAMVRAFARDAGSPAQLCSRVNQVLCENIAPDKFVTFFYGVLDAEDRTFRYCNAGHPSPLLVSSDFVLRLVEGGSVLGVQADWQYKDSQVELSPGDRLLLFTDGITEAPGPDDQEFGQENIAALAQANRTSSASELNHRLLDRVTEFCSGQFHDDVTLLVIAVND